jgi:PAP2 superfamily
MATVVEPHEVPEMPPGDVARRRGDTEVAEVAEVARDSEPLPGLRRRPLLLWQIALTLIVIFGYDAVNNLAARRSGWAVRNGLDVLHFEQRLGIDPEHALNSWLAARHGLGTVANYFYDNAHFVVTFGLLAAVWWWRPERYRYLRDALFAVNVVGLLVYWAVPVAPPRLIGLGFVDTVDAFRTLGSFHSGSLAADANQFAAMPSLHLGYAVWSSLAIVTLLRGRRAWPAVAGRVVAWLYPVLVGLVVMATANHYLMDALAGVAATGVGLLTARALQRVHARWQAWRIARVLGGRRPVTANG